ncbi:MAG: GAF domain-containing sensor histidine kinase [Firmicutes bacterium]|jgi:signal transduction histidine kinase|nr:GAF domain-containing sensor histidine kinase [Bacillota bacterium]
MLARKNQTQTTEAALSTDNIRLFQGPEDNEIIDALLILSRVTSAVSGLCELNAILRVGLEKTLEYMGGICGGILLLDDRDKCLTYCVYRGLPDDFARKISVKIGEGINGRVALTGKAVLMDDISDEPEAALSCNLTNIKSLRSFISVPLRYRERVLGVLTCASPLARRFTEKDMHLLHSIGDQLGLAIGQARLHARLLNKKEKIRQVALQVITAQEEEKKRISQELHDETCQMLAALTLNLQVLIEMAELIGIRDNKFNTMLTKTYAMAVQINNEVGRLVSDLRPVLLDSLGFIPAIRHYAESCLLPLGINVNFDIENAGVTLLPEIEVNLFRWVQSMIGNVVRHSQAKNVNISMREKDRKLEICIQDDGIGFDVTQLGKITGKKKHGMGLMIAKERIKLFGGDLSVHSQPGKGTAVRAVIPL